MKTLSEVSSDKLRGGFYTPEPLVDVCLERISEFTDLNSKLSVLEPSVGDGAFLRRLAANSISEYVERFVGLEIEPREAQKCRELARNISFETAICTMSTIEWAVTTDELFDIVIGNPPFVRYQFIQLNDLQYITTLGLILGLPLRGVSNLWIPVLLGALNRLRPGGSMALVVPAELFTGFSAGDARLWLLSNFTQLRIDMFQPGAFPKVLQEVVVISGRKIDEASPTFNKNTCVNFVTHSDSGSKQECSHLIPQSTQSWTRYLLAPVQLDALREAQTLPQMQLFGTIAKLEVSIVTGANEFFSVNREELEKFELQPWAEPLLPRTRHADGLIYTNDDHKMTSAAGFKAWLLNFSENHPDPQSNERSAQYLAIGEAQGLHTRYKTSIRSPWYRVPSVWSGKLLLSKRCHWFPRLIYNEAGVVTTDTIYRGQMMSKYNGQELDLVTIFHNSLTLLTAEVEGRSFGGGVLELVPSEIARLIIPFPVNIKDQFFGLNQIARKTTSNPQSQTILIEKTDELLSQHVKGLSSNLLHQLREAREFLLNKRLSRN